MLKKVLKAIAKLEAHAKKSDATQLVDGSSLSKKLHNAINDLEARAKEHDFVATMARDAARQLRESLKVGAPIAKVAPTASTRSAKKPVAKSKPASSPATKIPASQANPVKKAAPVQTTPTKPKAVARPPVKPVTKSKGNLTLADAIQYVLKSRRDQNAGSVKARQLYDEVQQAGYQFGGNNVENRMNYLHKTLRQHAPRFKRAADGAVSLA